MQNLGLCLKYDFDAERWFQHKYIRSKEKKEDEDQYWAHSNVVVYPQFSYHHWDEVSPIYFDCTPTKYSGLGFI